MQIRGTLNDGQQISYARGLAIGDYKGLKIVEHSGGDAGYRSHLMRFPDQRFSVACLCNAGTANPSLLARQVADIYLESQLVAETKPAAAPSISGINLSEQQRASKVGVYWSSRMEDLARVTQTSGKLYLAAMGGSSELLALSENRFRILARPGEVSFESGGDGISRRLVLKLEGNPDASYEAVKSAAPTPEQLAEYAGAYYSDEIDATYRVALQDGKLVLLRRKFPRQPLTAVFVDAFTSGGLLGTIRFTRDKDQRVTGFVAGGGRVKNLRFLRQPQ